MSDGTVAPPSAVMQGFGVGTQVAVMHEGCGHDPFPATVQAVEEGAFLIEWSDGLEEGRRVTASDMEPLDALTSASLAERSRNGRTVRLVASRLLSGAVTRRIAYAPTGAFLSTILDKTCPSPRAGAALVQGLRTQDAATVDDICSNVRILNPARQLLEAVSFDLSPTSAMEEVLVDHCVTQLESAQDWARHLTWATSRVRWDENVVLGFVVPPDPAAHGGGGDGGDFLCYTVMVASRAPADGARLTIAQSELILWVGRWSHAREFEEGVLDSASLPALSDRGSTQFRGPESLHAITSFFECAPTTPDTIFFSSYHGVPPGSGHLGQPGRRRAARGRIDQVGLSHGTGSKLSPPGKMRTNEGGERIEAGRHADQHDTVDLGRSEGAVSDVGADPAASMGGRRRTRQSAATCDPQGVGSGRGTRRSGRGMTASTEPASHFTAGTNNDPFCMGTNDDLSALNSGAARTLPGEESA